MHREPSESKQANAARESEQRKKKRFRIVKLEERLAPGGGNGKHSMAYLCGRYHNKYTG